MIKKILLGFVIAIGSIFLLLVLALVGYGGYSVYANDKADQAATFLCDQIKIGSDIDSAIALAQRSTERNRLFANENKYRFIFYGAIFHSSECVADTLDGKVVSVQMKVNDD
ncbi:MAG: hypothetical protein ACREPB_14850 [Arenimonas sp.]